MAVTASNAVGSRALDAFAPVSASNCLSGTSPTSWQEYSGQALIPDQNDSVLGKRFSLPRREHRYV